MGTMVKPLHAGLASRGGLAAALVDGQLEVEQFRDEKVRDPLVRDLMGRLTIEPHPDMAQLDFTKGKDFLGMEVIVKLKNGRTVSRHIKSGFSVPAVDGAGVHRDLIAKFTRNAKRVLPERKIEECIDRIERVESASGMADFLAPLRHDWRTGRAA